MKTRKRKFQVIHSSDLKICLRHDKRELKKSPVVVLDLSKKSHQEIIIAEHKSITYFNPPENNLLRVFRTPSAGFGVVAYKETIKKNQFLCTYLGERVVQKIEAGEIPEYEEITKTVALKIKKLTKNVDRPLTSTEQEELDEFATQLAKYYGLYIFVVSETKKKLTTVLSHRKSGIAALVNCSWTGFANAEAKLVNNNIVYQALRDIQPGEEIQIDYGDAYTDAKNYQDYFPIGSRSIEKFLKQNDEHYPSQPIILNEGERELLGTQATHVLVPYYYSCDLQKLKLYKANQINILPVIEMAKDPTSKTIKPLPSQQFISVLMYTCLKKNKTLFNRLIQKKVCVNFVTNNGRSAWYILTASYNNTPLMHKMCEQLTKAIYQLYDKRGWADAYDQYIQKNLQATSLENQATISSTIFMPNSKTKSWIGKKINYIKVYDNSSDSEETPISSTKKTNCGNKRKSIDLTPEPLEKKLNRSHLDLAEETSIPSSKKTNHGHKRKSMDTIDLTPSPIDLAIAITEKNVSAVQSIVNSILADELIDLLETTFENGDTERKALQGCHVITVAAASGHLDIFQCLLKAIGITQMLRLINLRQGKGQFLGLTALGIALINGSIEILTMMLTIMSNTTKFEALTTPQPEGMFQGCTTFIMAVLTHQLSAVRAILDASDNEQKISLITTYQTMGRAKGFNAISMSVKLWNIDLLHCMLNTLPPTLRLDILNSPNPTGIEKGLSALGIAKKYQKSESVQLMLERIRPLTSIETSSNKFTLFNAMHGANTQAKFFTRTICSSPPL
jgi:hypothetical protein